MWKSVAVFCGSKTGNNPIYTQHAKEIGNMLGKKNIQLIYGGGKNGLMGIVASAALNNNGKVIGVMPSVLSEKEHQHDKLTTLHIVKTMHERKKMMYELCDAAIILPGGFGTLDELFEMITWNNLNIHDKQIVLLNSDGFYNHMLAHFEKMQEEHFLYKHAHEKFSIIDSPQALASLMDEGIHQSHHE